MSEEFKGYLWPLGNHDWPISSRYGERIHPVTKQKCFHNGIDVACPCWSSVFSPCAGKVRFVWNDTRNGGGLSIIISDGRLRFGFCHLSGVYVSTGDKVLKGEIIAMTGGTPGLEGAGRSTGAHLHITVRSMKNYSTIDPECILWDRSEESIKANVKRAIRIMEQRDE